MSDRGATLACGSDFIYLRYGTQSILGHEPAGLRDDGTAVVVEATYGCMAMSAPPGEAHRSIDLAISDVVNVVRSAWVQSSQGRGESPSTARTIMTMACQSDVCEILSAIRVPTLVMHSRDNRMANVENGRYYFARKIRGATYLEIPGSDHPACLGDADQILDEIEEMVTGKRRAVDVDRVVASIVFTDIVGSTERVVEIGDRRWRKLLDEHDRRRVHGELRRSRPCRPLRARDHRRGPHHWPRRLRGRSFR